MLNDIISIFFFIKSIYNKPNIMSFDQEYTIYFLQGSVTAYFLRAKGPSGNKQFQIPSGNKFVYSFTKLTILSVYPSVILRRLLIVFTLMR